MSPLSFQRTDTQVIRAATWRRQTSSWFYKGGKGDQRLQGEGSGSGELGSPLHPAGRQLRLFLSPSSSSLWWPEEAPEQLRIGSFMGTRYMTHHIPPREAATLPMGCEPGLEPLPSLSP